MKRNLAILIPAIIISFALLVASLALYIATPKEIEITEIIQTEVATFTIQTEMADVTEEQKETIMTVNEPQTEVATELDVVAPKQMLYLLSQNGNTVEDLQQLGCSQLVTVNSSGSYAQIDFYQLDGCNWILDEGLSCSGYVGRNGVTEDMNEGGNASPKGLFSIGDAFYIYNAPVTNLQTFHITNDTYWIDDPNSVYYNKRIEGTDNKDWNSAEHMIDYTTAYEYGFVINYNIEAIYNAGSAIFFHVSYNPTAGCVGTDREHVMSYLAKLNALNNPYILIL